jgi:hypothetical protein
VILVVVLRPPLLRLRLVMALTFHPLAPLSFLFHQRRIGVAATPLGR